MEGTPKASNMCWYIWVLKPLLPGGFCHVKNPQKSQNLSPRHRHPTSVHPGDFLADLQHLAPKVEAPETVFAFLPWKVIFGAPFLGQPMPTLKHPENHPNDMEFPYQTMVSRGCLMLGGWDYNAMVLPTMGVNHRFLRDSAGFHTSLLSCPNTSRYRFGEHAWIKIRYF